MNKSKTDALKSFSMPFQTLRDVKLEQPLLTPNYLKGISAENVYMYEAPPPYAGIGQAPPVPAGNLQMAGKLAPTAPPPAYS
ncbi:hypothetical protein ANCDUO_04333 [Ancylostoma duodenale]|uniref:Uncharacterized protein n=1 Tax=Ancylostoma duodenale TaxID=51022 RepID=A0A0C2D6W7_9BILA|nr:hypothetical protein ANCDUO_04333 [Ancylostoma duodenale]